MAYLNWQLALVALIPFPLLIASALTYTLTVHQRYRLHRSAASDANTLLHDNLAGIRQIKSFVREKEEHARFNRISDRLRYATLIEPPQRQHLNVRIKVASQIEKRFLLESAVQNNP